MQSPRPRERRAGFTLIEMMAVVLIIGLLAGIVGVAVFSSVNSAKVSTTQAQIKNLESALAFYQMDNGDFPTTDQGLQALVQKPTSAPTPESWRQGGYLQTKTVPKDAWKHDFQYLSPGQHNPDSYDLWSLGSDGQPGGTGTKADIGNWSDESATQ
jgi:general secretion pathway protein G